MGLGERLFRVVKFKACLSILSLVEDAETNKVCTYELSHLSTQAKPC